ncbi:Acyl-[acyl-carrier-protein]--UDP-N-acetylglucosamine O-acyltransferase [Candidatus Magnetomorum sp. HK-1]|nr:Acyl-[acyl-carrier-protein]--UDP-N-acetylglucosamine O-acyltransferase [Candidatus Magnetomorum sp. HK-1]
MIHPTAIVDKEAELDTNVEIGPYSVIARKVKIGKNSVIGPHVTVDEYTTIGEDCKIFQFSSIGAVPQALKYEGAKTEAIIGDGSVIREFVTINRGTEFGGGVTEIGKRNYLMAYCHIAHDCRTGKEVVFSNNATMAGHIHVGDCATIGGLVAVHQFVRIGEYSFIGGKSAVVKDVPPYVIAAGDRATLHGLNKVGLKRRGGFTDDSLKCLKKAYRIVFRLGLTLNEAIERIKAQVDDCREVTHFVEFLQSSERGITR